MSELSHYAFVASFAMLLVALILHAGSAVTSRSRLALAGGGTIDIPSDEFGTGPTVSFGSSGRQAAAFTILAFAFLTVSLASRAIVTGHGPFSSMFEFSLAFAWGILGLALYFDVRYRLRTLSLLVLPISLGLLTYAATVPSNVEPLVPALQNQLLLTVHVAIAIVAYGAFTVACAAAVLFLVQRHDTVQWLPRSSVLDEIGYKAVIVGFPLLALVILLGAIWAEIAWGTYWSWDPKETASLATWLIYGGYLHARVVRGWRGQRSALLLIGGFAATLFTYYGNLFFGGMHAYA